jgi:hypothetical protein
MVWSFEPSAPSCCTRVSFRNNFYGSYDILLLRSSLSAISELGADPPNVSVFSCHSREKCRIVSCDLSSCMSANTALKETLFTCSSCWSPIWRFPLDERGRKSVVGYLCTVAHSTGTKQQRKSHEHRFNYICMHDGDYRDQVSKAT